LRAKTIKKILRKHGFAAETVRFHIFRLSFLTRLSPALSLAVARAMNFISGEWLAINCIIKARKVRGDH
jgi:hypothetical protein